SLVDGAALLLAIPGSPVTSAGLLAVLHTVLLTIIIVEILETVLVYFRTSRIQVRPILIAGLTAMVRKVIVMGVESFNAVDILATAVVIAVLTAAVLLVGKEEEEKLAQ
ncbi:MAG: phosphate-starvation-inducible PsiE family protein, partial [Methanomicrobiales archaeon]|nr:phosphate-starvation-inducible PsiE family protein [Methanomicrobiales archaeon]